MYSVDLGTTTSLLAKVIYWEPFYQSVLLVFRKLQLKSWYIYALSLSILCYNVSMMCL